MKRFLDGLRGLAPGAAGAARAGRALRGAYIRGDSVRVRRYFKVAGIGSVAGGLLMAAILLVLAAAMFGTAAETDREANRAPVSVPAQAGMPPEQALVDETGFVSDYYLEHLPEDLAALAEKYHIQTAVYASFQPAHDVYDQFFQDENGVVLYVEEHEDYGTLTYYWGSNLDGLFTADNIRILDGAQTYLDAFTHDRVPNVVYDFQDGLRTLFYGRERARFSAPFAFGTAVFWLIMAVVSFFLMRALICAVLQVPFSRKKRDLYLAAILEAMEENRKKADDGQTR